MFSMIAWSENIDPAAATVKLAAVPDQHLKTEGDRFTVPTGMRFLIGAAAFADTDGIFARLVSPSLRRFNPFYIFPLFLGLVSALSHPDWIFGADPVPLDVNESLEAEQNATGGAATVRSIVALLADGPVAPVSGEIRTIRATITLALVASVWAFSELTLVDELPTGTYSVVGAQLVDNEAIAFRFVPVGAAHRPGGLVTPTNAVLANYAQRHGGLGVWFDFDTTQLPGVEVLSSAAENSATYNMFIDVMVR